MAKDKIFKSLGASNHCDEEREEYDFYATDPNCVKDLLAVETFEHNILEPCCGEGNISKVLEENGYEVISTDLIDRGYGRGDVDFFKEYQAIDRSIISNPPYNLATEFVDHALTHAVKPIKIALFLKLQFLEGAERFTKIFSKNHLEKIYVYSKRVACYKNNEMYQKDKNGNYKLDSQGNKLKIGSAVCFCWFIFNTEYTGFPTIQWVNTPKENQKPDFSNIELF